MLALLAVPATAAPVGLLDAFAAPCSGNGDISPSLVPAGRCYAGSGSVLTISETAIVNIKSYDPATGSGSLRLDAEGMATVHCPPATFKKVSGSRDIEVSGLEACGKLKKAVAAVEYCSDQDTIRVHVKVPDDAAPGASSLPMVPITLKPTECKLAHTDLRASKAK